MASRKEIFDRRIRLIQAVQGRRFEDVYLQDPVFRKDLEDEAKLGRKRPNDALCTPETLRNWKPPLIGGSRAARSPHLPRGLLPRELWRGVASPGQETRIRRLL